MPSVCHEPELMPDVEPEKSSSISGDEIQQTIEEQIISKVEVLESPAETTEETQNFEILKPNQLERDYEIDTSPSPCDNEIQVSEQDKNKTTDDAVSHDTESIQSFEITTTPIAPRRKTHQGHPFIVAIDLGTTYSGYAFCATSDPDNIFLMRRWEGGDPGVINQKVPTSMLLNPKMEFHSFGYTARDTFHDLDPAEAREWYFLERFKLKLHSEKVKRL